MPLLHTLRSFSGLGRLLNVEYSANLSPLLHRTFPRRQFSQHQKLQFRWNAYEPPPKDHPTFQKAPRHSQQSQDPKEPRRLNRLQWLQGLWRNDPRFRIVITVGGTGYIGFILYNIEKVPETGRWRFNCVSQEREVEFGKAAYEETLSEYQGRIFPDMHPYSIRVRKVLNRLLPATGLPDQGWEVHVIDDNQANAFVIPGGKVFVFKGILPIAGNDDGLATILGHEIAHNVLHHMGEKMSRSVAILTPLIYLLTFALDVTYTLPAVLLTYAYDLPGSRKQETEADMVGLMIMAKSCFNPDEAVHVWERMEEAQKAQGQQTPQFMSTHPSNYNRIGKMQSWLPEAYDKQAASACQGLPQFAQEFRSSAAALTDVW